MQRVCAILVVGFGVLAGSGCAGIHSRDRMGWRNEYPGYFGHAPYFYMPGDQGTAAVQKEIEKMRKIRIEVPRPVQLPKFEAPKISVPNYQWR